jgi:hypothetical protein
MSIGVYVLTATRVARNPDVLRERWGSTGKQAAIGNANIVQQFLPTPRLCAAETRGFSTLVCDEKQ